MENSNDQNNENEFEKASFLDEEEEKYMIYDQAGSKIKRYLQKQIILNDSIEADKIKNQIQKDQNKMNVIPERSIISKEINELLDSVHGAIKARIQLGFDQVASNQFNLRPIIKDLEVKLQANINPIINGNPKQSKPPLILNGMNSSYQNPKIASKSEPPSENNYISRSKSYASSEMNIGQFDDNNMRFSEMNQKSIKDAAQFVKKLNKEKAERQKNLQEINLMKDQKFLAKMHDTLENRKKAVEIKEKDKQMRYQHMMKNLEKKKIDRLSNLGGDVESFNKVQPKVLKEIQSNSTHRLLKQNQYKSYLDPLKDDFLSQQNQENDNIFGIQSQKLKISYNFRNNVTKVTKEEIQSQRQNIMNSDLSHIENLTNNSVKNKQQSKPLLQINPFSLQTEKQQNLSEALNQNESADIQYTKQQSQLNILEDELKKQTSSRKPNHHVQFENSDIEVTEIPINDNQENENNNQQKHFISDVRSGRQLKYLIKRDDIYKNRFPDKPSFKSKFHEQIKQEKIILKTEKEKQLENKIEALTKKQNYGKFVKEEYMPPRSQKKIEELDQQIQQISNYNKKKYHLNF